MPFRPTRTIPAFYLCGMETFAASPEYALELDARDPLRGYRDHFHLPSGRDGRAAIYLCGNSLGLQPRQTREYVLAELEDWARLGVEGHTEARHPWMPYHEFLTPAMARVVGALPEEVVVMNSLTVNLHLLMVSFYRPTPQRRKILIEYSPFPSDRYAVSSQIAYHGFDPREDLVELKPRPGTDQVYYEDLEAIMAAQGEQIALILIGGVNYYTGQAYDLGRITRLGHQYGCMVGFDLAHAAGNLPLRLHEDGPDFAAWCSYKYLNGGPGALSGIFVHQRHGQAFDLPRFTGWWGHDKSSRFRMPDTFQPLPGAEGWQLSNPPILPMAAMRASLDLFDQAGMDALAEKSRLLTGWMAWLLRQWEDPRIELITPSDPDQRGCQLSVRVKGADKAVFQRLSALDVVADWREPDVIRVAPVPLYNSFADVWTFTRRLQQTLQP
jgi:kynureninase